MSDLENLILPITFNNWNTYTFSSRANTLLSFSPDMGAIPHPISYNSPPPDYLFDDEAKPIPHQTVIDQCKAIDGSEDLESALVNMLQDYKDIEGDPILDSNFNFTLPYAFKHSQSRTTSLRRYSTHTKDSLWLGLLEYKTEDKFNPDITNFTFKTNLADIDLLLNAYLEQHIDLSGSDNYLQTILNELANRRGELIDIDDAVDYFILKPFRMLILASEKGVKHIMENGYNEYRDQLFDSYKMEESHRESIPFVYVTRLFDNRYVEKSSIAYDKTCQRLDIQPNWNLFEQWHNYNYADCNTWEDNLVNTIIRISTGYDFTRANWGYFQRAVFELGCKQHTHEASSKVFEEWINRRR